MTLKAERFYSVQYVRLTSSATQPVWSGQTQAFDAKGAIF